MKLSINVLDLIPNFIKNFCGRYSNNKLFDFYGLKVWRNQLIEIACNHDAFDEQLARRFAYSRTLTRIYYSMFDQGKSLEIKNIALSLAMEVIDNHIQINEKIIIQYAVAIYKQWHKELLENEILRERYERISEHPVKKFPLKLDSNIESDLLDILNNKTIIRQEFFKSYSMKEWESNETIIVYLPNDLGFIDWSSKFCIEVKVNAYEGIDLGFFRVGYDYNILPNNSGAWYVSISKNKRKEAVNFFDSTIGKTTTNYIWVK